jgi:hypothetical protein
VSSLIALIWGVFFNLSAQKDQGDTNFNETVKKAEIAAVAKSLKEVAKQLNAFLTKVPTLE